MNQNQPTSPHLQVYRLPLVAKLSIIHRATGVALGAGLLLIAYVVVALAQGPEAYASAQECLNSWFGTLVLLGWSVALYYHMCNGIRHLFWDVGRGLELESADLSGKIVIVATAVLTALTWIIA